MKCVCGSERIVKAGKKATRSGKRQRLFCNDCGRTFYDNKEEVNADE